MAEDLVFQKRVNARRLVDELMAIPGVTVDLPLPSMSGLPSPVKRLLLTYTVNEQDSTIRISPDNSLSQSVLDQITAVVTAHDGAPDPVPPVPDFGTDVPSDFNMQRAQAITNLRQYLQVATPTAAQSTAALKTLIRVVLYREKQMDGG